MANPKIKQLPSGNYNALVYSHTDENGKRKYKSITAPSKREVKLLIAEFLASREYERSKTDDITVLEAMENYIRSKDNVLSPSTVLGYESLARIRFKKIHDVKLSDLTDAMVQDAVNVEAAHLSPKTVANAHALLMSSLRLAKWKPDERTTLPQKIKPDINIPTDEEVRTMLRLAKDTELEVPLYLALFCGMRRSEIMGLRWEQVDLDKGKLTVMAAVVTSTNGFVRREKTKETESKRTITIFKPALELLRRTHQNGLPIVSYTHPNSIGKAFTRMLARSGMPHYRFHDCRHYCVSSMLALNIPKKYIADYVGHASEKMIDRVYGHIMANKKSEFMATADDHFSAIFGQMQDEMQNETEK